MKNKLLISFSGGRTSAYMAWWLLNKWNERHEWEMIVVFANTGKERNETLDFVNECDLYFGFNTVWIEAVTNPIRGIGVSSKIVTYSTANRDGEPFEQMVKKHGIPSVKSPHCTRELKKYAIKAYCRSIGWKKYHTAIGYRVDEFDRAAPDWEKQRHFYPLISPNPTRKNDINKFWGQQDFDLRLKTYEGNCDLCFKKSFRKLMTLTKESPELILWWSGMEFKYHDFIPEGKSHNKKLIPPINFYRQNKSIWDIIDMAKNNFEMAADESKYYPEYKQGTLFGIDLDVSNGCTESCEVF
jgi:3'-phosphoadenosine 5'-phosphosulfate sulfotransferase (PAPS reductase)/FAD synthetase